MDRNSSRSSNGQRSFATLALSCLAILTSRGFARSTPIQGAVCAPSWSATFDGHPGVDRFVYALATFDDGSGPALYVGGDFTRAGGVAASNLAKWDGVRWSALGNGVDDVVRALTVFDDGSGPALYAGGDFASAGGAPASHLAKWNGSNWSALGTGVDGTGVRAFAVFDEGFGPALFVGGDFTTAGGISARRVAKWDGVGWSALGTGMSDGVHALAVFDDGGGPQLYAGGAFGMASGVSVNHLAKWNGSTWKKVSVPAIVGGDVDVLTTFDDGAGTALYAAGSFTSIAASPVNHIAKWNGSSWSTLAGGTNGAVFGLATFDDGSGPALYATGAFGAPASGIAKWNGASWSALSGGLSQAGFALATFDDGPGAHLYVGGQFSTVDNLPAMGIAKWRAAGWSQLGHGLNGAVAALEAFDDGSGPALVAGGSFAFVGDVAANGVAKWNGANWSALGSGIVGYGVYAFAVFDDGNGPALYAGGSFSSIGGVPASNIAKWNGSTWSTLGGGVGSSVFALTVFDDGSGAALYAGGAFTTANGAPANRVAKWNGSSWSALGAGADNYVDSLAVFDDGAGSALYVGGQFLDIGGVHARYIAKWNGTGWSALAGGMNDYGYVNALAVFDDGSGSALYAGGRFDTAGGVAASCIAKWNGANWSSVAGGMSGSVPFVDALEVFDDGGGSQLYAAGNFALAGGVPANNLAKWNGASWSGVGDWAVAGISDFAAFDDGPGEALFVGGGFATSPLGDSYITRWGCAPTSSGRTFCTAGTTSSGCVPAISGVGVASASTGSGFTIQVANVEGQKVGLIFYGTSGAHPVPWSAASTSWLCVKAPTQRLGTQSSGGTLGACNGAFADDWNAYIASHPSALGQTFAGGEIVWAQAWFRDPPAPKTTNLSDGLIFLVAP